MAPSTSVVRGLDALTGGSVELTLEAGRVASVAPCASAERVWLAPGFVDLQVNGFAGQDLNAPDVTSRTVHDLAQAMLKVGVTTFLPTLITNSERNLIRGLEAIRQAREEHPIVRRMVPFVHVEGPHIAPEDGPRGAHPVEHVRPPSLDEFARWQAASGGLVGLVTLSPHWAGATEYIAGLVRQGVRVSIGHTAANAAQIAAAVEAGARLSTHLGNGSHATMNRRENHLWPQLADDRLTAMFIADGHHLSPHLLKVMLRAKGLDRALVVSDTVALGGMPAGRYRTPVGGAVILREDGFLGLDDGTGNYLAGAALPMLAAIPVLVHQGGLTLAEAVRLMTANPGRWTGGRGEFKAGAEADLVQFEWDGSSSLPVVRAVWLAGERVV
jgi:N-acetylglucosamine-6-phosphate deacetylase